MKQFTMVYTHILQWLRLKCPMFHQKSVFTVQKCISNAHGSKWHLTLRLLNKQSTANLKEMEMWLMMELLTVKRLETTSTATSCTASKIALPTFALPSFAAFKSTKEKERQSFFRKRVENKTKNEMLGERKLVLRLARWMSS